MDFTLLFVDSFPPLIFNLIIAVIGDQSAIEKRKYLTSIEQMANLNIFAPRKSGIIKRFLIE